MPEHNNEHEVDTRIKDLVLWSKPEAQAVLNTECAQANIRPEVIEQLLVWIRENQHRGRRAGLTDAFDDIFINVALWENDNVAQ